MTKGATKGTYQALTGTSGKWKRLPMLKRRTVNGLEDYMSGLEDRVEELSSFQAWAVGKMDEQEQAGNKMKKDITELRDAKTSLLRRIVVITRLMKERYNSGGYGACGQVKEQAVQMQEPRPSKGTSPKRDMNDCISPTTPSVPTHRYVAVQANPPCPPAGFRDKTSSEDGNNVEQSSPPRKRPRSTRQAAVRPSTPEGFFKLTFTETQTQPPQSQAASTDEDDQ